MSSLKKHKLYISILSTDKLEVKKLMKSSSKNIKTIDNSKIDLYPDKEKEKALSSAFTCSRKDSS